MEAFRWLLQRPPNRGDAAILKAEALGTRAPAWLDAMLKDVEGYFPVVDIAALRTLPDGTFGREYARHMDQSGLNPYVISPTLDHSLLKRHTYLVRQTVTHDMAHLLLDFDSSDVGEMGIYAFTVVQGAYTSMHVGLWLAAVIYPLRYPLRAKAIFDAIRRGWLLGKRSRFFLGVRLEELWQLSVGDVRETLGLPRDPMRPLS